MPAEAARGAAAADADITAADADITAADADITAADADITAADDAEVTSGDREAGELPGRNGAGARGDIPDGQPRWKGG